MDHRRIKEMSIPELYATGRLSTDDEEAFEAHLLECRECREQVAWADDFGASVRAVAVESLTALETARAATRAGFLAWLARRGHAVRLGLTAALVIVAGLPAWLLVERSSLQGELAEARAALERPAAPVPPARPVPQGPDAATKAELDRLTRERARLAEDLGREREARHVLSDRLDGLLQPQANTAVISLGTVRGASDAGETVELLPDPEYVVLSLELPDAEYETYHATFYDATGHRLWQLGGLKPTGSATLDILVHSDLLKSGEYKVSLEGVDEGRAVPIDRIPFQVRKN